MTHRGSAPKHLEKFPLAILAALAAWLSGCATRTDQGPWRVSKPNMQFSEARAFNSPIRIGLQLEPGRVGTGGAQASVCTSCR